MNAAAKTLILLTVLVITFVGGAITACTRHWLQPVASLVIVNKSAQDITEFQLMTESGSQSVVASFGGIPKGQARTFLFFVSGEAGYRVVARMANGQVLKNKGGYAEPGYELEATVTSTGISDTVKAFNF